MKELTPATLAIRSDAKIINVGILAGLFGLFASVPISIRQKDWKIWTYPFIAAVSLLALAELQNDSFQKALFKVLGHSAQGGLCAALVSQNKRDAREKLGTL
jgi:hypothetical protein